jgi:hypothetical protein
MERVSYSSYGMRIVMEGDVIKTVLGLERQNGTAPKKSVFETSNFSTLLSYKQPLLGGHLKEPDTQDNYYCLRAVKFPYS